MVRVIGVRFRTAGKIYFFDPLQYEIKREDHVIVETARGIEFGTVVSDAHEVEEDKVVQPLKPVIRIANQRDVEQEQANRRKEKEAFQICLEKIRRHELEMKLIDAEYTFDNNKVLFYFTADGRIDFRELVKDLASVFKTRIELRQIGVRDETKIIGGIGICGRPLCCHSYLSDFIPVSIKMAKEQNLSLNPTKISGVCGRLMCCLKNEEETYEELNRKLPSVGDTVTAEDGSKGEVQSVNVLRQLVKVLVEEGDAKEIREYEVGQLHFKRKHTKKERMELSAEELQELERLEQEDLEEIQAEEKENAKPDNRSGSRFNGQRENGRQESDRPEGSRGDYRRERNNRENFGERRNHQENSRQDGNRPKNNRREGNRYDGNRTEGSRRDGTRYEGNRTEGSRRDGTRYEGNRSEGSRREENRYEGNRSEGSRREENRYDGNRTEHNRQEGGHQDNRSGDRHYRRDRKYRSGRKPEQNGNAGNSSENQ